MGNSGDLRNILYLQYIMRTCESIKSHQFKTSACSTGTIQSDAITVSCLGSCCVGAVLEWTCDTAITWDVTLLAVCRLFPTWNKYRTCRSSVLWSPSGPNWNGHLRAWGGYPGWVLCWSRKWRRNLEHFWYGGKRYAVSLPCSEATKRSPMDRRGKGNCVCLVTLPLAKIV
jgi:hypothetical protein